MRGLVSVFCLSGRRWSFTWWSVLPMAPPSGSPPPRSSTIWSRPTSRRSSRRSECSCLSHARSCLRLSSNSCCRMHPQVNGRVCVVLSLSSTGGFWFVTYFWELSLLAQEWTPSSGSRLRWTTLNQRSKLVNDFCQTSHEGIYMNNIGGEQVKRLVDFTDSPVAAF